MKTIYNFFIVLTSILFLGIGVNAQSTKVHKEYDENGNLSLQGNIFTDLKGETHQIGKWSFYYPDGMLKAEGEVNEGLKTGLWTVYYPNGEKHAEGEYLIYKDLLSKSQIGIEIENERYSYKCIGTWYLYWDDGTKATSYTFSDNNSLEIDIVNTKYHPKFVYQSGNYGSGEIVMGTKQLFEISTDGSSVFEILGLAKENNFFRHGKWTEFYASGEKLSSGIYDWELGSQGFWESYYKSGTLKSRIHYIKNEIEGSIERYYENGQISEKYSLLDGEIDGKFESWDENGNLKEKSYSNGFGETERTLYNPNGKVKETGVTEKIDGEHKKEGNWTQYYENGEKKLVIVYSHNKIIGYWEQYLVDGTQTLKNGNGVYYIFKDGVMTLKSDHRDGSRSGITTWYYSNGQIKQSAYYEYDEDSKPYGLRMEILSSFHKDGSLREKGTLKDGYGTWYNYDDEGNVSEIQVYSAGMKDSIQDPLTTLDLSGKGLIKFPDRAFEMPKLTTLILSNNKISSLPENISNLTNLKILKLDENNLNSLPESIGHLTNLEKLDLSGNNLSSLPRSIGNLTNLKYFRLRDNDLSSLPESIGNLTGLTEFYLSFNELESLPISIGKLTKLEIFGLNSNNLNSLPESIEDMISLNFLKLEDNNLNLLPESIGNLPYLILLHLTGNELTKLPENVVNWPNRMRISLSESLEEKLSEQIELMKKKKKYLSISWE